MSRRYWRLDEKTLEFSAQLSQDFGCGLDLLDVVHRLAGVKRHRPDLAANVPGRRAGAKRSELAVADRARPPIGVALTQRGHRRIGVLAVERAGGQRRTERPLLGSGPDFQMSIVACANAPLHARILDAVAAGMATVAPPAGASEPLSDGP